MSNVKTFEEVVKPVIEWLNKNSNPHAILIVENTGAVLYSGEQSVQTEEFIKD